MTSSIYAPPKADLTMHGELAGDGFYVVSQRKFLVLFFLTMGWYKLYWYYKNWSMYKAMNRYTGGIDGDIWPVPRALFPVFFTHSLMREATAYGATRDRDSGNDGETTATIVVLLIVAANIVDRVAANGIGNPATTWLAILFILPLAYYMNVARQLINDASGDPQGDSNSNFTWANWIWIVIGTLFWIVVAVGIWALANGYK